MVTRKTDPEIKASEYDPDRWPKFDLDEEEPLPSRLPGLEFLTELREGQVDWKTIIEEVKAVTSENNDYSIGNITDLSIDNRTKNILLDKMQKKVFDMLESEQPQDITGEEDVEPNETRTDEILEKTVKAERVTAEKSDQPWYYLKNQKQIGPIAEFMVHDLIGLGDIVADTLLWNPGLPEWKSAFELGFVEAAAEVVKEEEEVNGANETESTPEQEWFISRNEEQFGPYTWPQIIEFSRDGNLHPDDYLWSASLPDWIRAADIEGLIK